MFVYSFKLRMLRLLLLYFYFTTRTVFNRTFFLFEPILVYIFRVRLQTEISLSVL